MDNVTACHIYSFFIIIFELRFTVIFNNLSSGEDLHAIVGTQLLFKRAASLW